MQKEMRLNKRIIINIFLLVFHVPVLLYAQLAMDDVPELRSIDVQERLGERIPLDLTFVDEKGDTVQLRKYF